MHAAHHCFLAGLCLVLLVSLSALPGCKGGSQQNRSPQTKGPGATVMPASALPANALSIPLVVKALTTVLLQRRPTAAELARPLGGTAVKDDLVNGYLIRTSDPRFEEVFARVSEAGARTHRKTIEDVTLLIKPGRVLHLSAMSRAFGKPSSPHITTTLGPGPNPILRGHYDERIMVAFPNAPGAGDDHSSTKNPVQLELTARLMRVPGPASPDPLVTEVSIYRTDWSDLF